MSMTAELKDELLGVHTGTPEGCRRAQLAAVLRLTATLRVSRGLVVAAEVSSASLARYLRREISELYGHRAVATVLPRNAALCGGRYLVRVAASDGGGTLARSIGMIDDRGRQVQGLPAAVVGGSPGEIEAAWRGAFLASGTLSGPGSNTSLEIRCPTTEVAYALASCARRIGVLPLVRESRGIDRVMVRAGTDIADLMTRIGAPESRLEWESRATRRRMCRMASLDAANSRRTADAAAETSARVERALTILGTDVPEHLAVTGTLRLTHGEASLEELGRLADPPLTKDAVAGRLRRLLALADKHEAALPVTVADPEPQLVAVSAGLDEPEGAFPWIRQ